MTRRTLWAVVVSAALASGVVAPTTAGAGAVPGLPGQLDPTFAGGTLVSEEITDGWDWASGWQFCPTARS